MTDNPESKELLRCPFCDSPASDIKLTYDIWSIECSIACCTQQDFDKNECVRLWNTRAPSQQLTTTQQALDIAVKALELIHYSNDIFINTSCIEPQKHIIGITDIVAQALNNISKAQ